MKKRSLQAIISIVIVLSMCLQMSVFALGTPFSDYVDIPNNHWAYASIKYVIDHNIMGETDDYHFDPDETASRAMIITTIHRIAGSPTPSNTSTAPFPDVPVGSWYCQPIQWAKQIGIIEGYDDGDFRPMMDMPREQIALIMYRYAQYCGYTTYGTGANTAQFPDYNETPVGCKPAMKWAIRKYMLVGRDNGKLMPNAAATRAELATCLHRFIVNNIDPTGISISETSKTVSRSWSGSISTTVLPVHRVGNETVYWTSSNSYVASVNSQTGAITANNVGTALITAHTAVGNYSASCTLVVKPNEYGDFRLGNFVTPESDDALNNIADSNALYNSIPYDSDYDQYVTNANATIVGGALLDMPNAAILLQHFLLNTGTTKTINFAEMIASNAKAADNWITATEDAMSAAEFFMSQYNDTLSFSSYKETEKLETEYDSTLGNVTNDWYFAIGKYRTWSSCTVSKSENTYTMTFVYHMRDFYNWDPDSTMMTPIVSQNDMYTLHCAGMAKDFRVEGQTTWQVTWTQGQRLTTGANWLLIS